jgi:hypothetical protein
MCPPATRFSIAARSTSPASESSTTAALSMEADTFIRTLWGDSEPANNINCILPLLGPDLGSARVQ